MKFQKIIYTFLLTLVFSSCGENKSSIDGDQANYPITTEKRLDRERGKLTGDGIQLIGGNVDMDRKSSSKNISKGVNAYLWQASLDVISFMPIASVDAVGGVIITDWYQDPNLPMERIKANIIISSDELRASGVHVSLFRQVATPQMWRDTTSNPDLARKLEDRIISRARELKIEDGRL